MLDDFQRKADDVREELTYEVRNAEKHLERYKENKAKRNGMVITFCVMGIKKILCAMDRIVRSTFFFEKM